MRSNPENGFSLNFNPAPSNVVHEFCGRHEIEGAFCLTCSKPLLRIASLAAGDSRLNVDPSKIAQVHLLYCWTCSIPYGNFSYQIFPGNVVKVLGIPPKSEYEFGSEGPYEGYTGHFPLKKVALKQLSDEEQKQQDARRRTMIWRWIYFRRSTKSVARQ